MAGCCRALEILVCRNVRNAKCVEPMPCPDQNTKQNTEPIMMRTRICSLIMVIVHLSVGAKLIGTCPVLDATAGPRPDTKTAVCVQVSTTSRSLLGVARNDGELRVQMYSQLLAPSDVKLLVHARRGANPQT